MKKFFRENLYVRLFVAFFKIGLFTFGGGMAMVPILQDKMVKEYGWMDEEEVIDCIAVSQSLPGVIAINMATYTGYMLRGFFGALIASLGIILPSFMIIILVVCFLEGFQDSPYVQGALTGITAAATGLVAYAAIKLSKQVLRGVFQWVIAVVSFVVIAVLGADAVWVILCSIGIGIIYNSYQLRHGTKQEGGRQK